VSCIYLNTCFSVTLWHLSGGTLDGTWTTLIMTIGLLSEFHLRISQTESGTANRHILSLSIQGTKTQTFQSVLLWVVAMWHFLALLNLLFQVCGAAMESGLLESLQGLNYCFFSKRMGPLRVSRTACQLTNSRSVLKTPNQSWSLLKGILWRRYWQATVKMVHGTSLCWRCMPRGN
jgi:hypothetical protein